MIPQGNDKQWGVGDFKRYHDGTMPLEERYALEKAALDDPFLFDALDGYSYSADPEKQIAELRQRLVPAKEDNSKKVIWFRRIQTADFLKVAAALILFAGLAWLLYPAKEDDQSTRLAANTEVAKSIDTTQAVSPIVSDTAVTAAAAGNSIQEEIPASAVLRPAPAAKAEGLAKEKLAKVSTDDNAAEKETYLTEPTIASAELNNPETRQALSRKNMEAAMPTTANVITGTVVDVQGKPVPYAVLNAPALNSNVAADANGNFTLPNSTNLQVVQADVNAVGFEKSNTALNANNSRNMIVMQESGNALSENVVIGYGNTKRSAAAPVAAAPEKLKAANPDDHRVILKNGKPLQSWEEFNESVSTEIKTNRFADTSGVVVLSFDIDDKGAPQNIAVVKKLCGTCDEQAKKILQRAPAIKKINKGKKVQALIRF